MKLESVKSILMRRDGLSEDEALDLGQWMKRLCLRGHASAKRTPSGEKWQRWRARSGFSDGGADGFVRERWRVGAP